MPDAFIYDHVRTPRGRGKADGSLHEVTALNLATQALVAIRERLSYAAPHFPLADHYNTSTWMYGRAAHERLVDSGNWHEHLDLASHRYMLEDVGMGLAFLVSVGAWADTPCPVAAGLLTIAGAANGEAFRGCTRTLQSLGLAGLSRDGMRNLLWEGI